MPRPRSLSLPTISAAALAVVERDGLAALTMRSVAAQLGTGTMSLYRYVEGREELERGIVELVLAGIDLDVPPTQPWDANVTMLLGRVRAAVGAHPAIIPLLLMHRHLSDSSVHFGETLLGLLTQGGFNGERRVVAFRTLLSFVFGSLQYQHLGPLSGRGTATLAQLPEDTFPLLTATARDAQHLTPDDEHARGLRAVLRGLTAEAAADTDSIAPPATHQSG